MASANRALLSLCILLAVAGALAATTVTTEAATRRRLQRMPKVDDGDAAGPLPTISGLPGPVVPLPPTAMACWKSILASKDCVDDILQSLAKLEVRVSKVCCSVLEKIGDTCIVDALSSFPFNPVLPPLVKHVCSQAA